MKIKNLKVSPLTFAIANTGVVLLTCGLLVNHVNNADENMIVDNENSYLLGMFMGGALSYDTYMISTCLKKGKSENNEEEMQNLNKEKVR